MLTSDEYAKDGGACPACGSDQIGGGPVTIEGAAAFQEVSCLECDATWEDVYRLTGYRSLDDLTEDSEDDEDEPEAPPQ
jgi:hypothetical protein